MNKIAGYVIIIFSILLLSGCGKENNMNFTFTNQSGNEFGTEDLSEKVWIADFIFTNCETVCPPMTAHMAQLQQKLVDAEVDAELVSFSVDPEVDTPEVLKEFGDRFDADYNNWNFLTGYSQSEIEEFAKVSFGALVQKPKDNDQVLHGTSFYLVDQSGNIIESYSGVETPPYDEIIEQIKKLQ